MRVFCAMVLMLLLALPAQADSWSEDFETTGCGLLPIGWTSGGGNSEMGSVWDVGDIVCNGNHSMGFFGLVGGCWAALATCFVDPDAQEYVANFSLEFTVRAGDEPTNGCHGGSRAYVVMSNSTNWEGDERGLFSVAQDGTFMGAGPTELGTFPLRTCHRVRIEYSRVSQENVSLSYAVDGGESVEVPVSAAAYEDQLRYFQFGSLEGSAWFDDVELTLVPVKGATDSWGSVKARYED